jgi:EpsI family protein
MSFTVLVLHVRGDQDRVLSSRPLSELPTVLGSRIATEFPLDQETLDTLGKGDFLNRQYTYSSDLQAATADDLTPIGLFIAYFPTQRTGQSIHSPQHCLPGAGWVFVESGVTELTDSDGTKRTVGEYLINNGRVSQEVLYWYQLHGRSIASDYKAKIYTLADSIRYGRTDEALVRIITPVNPGEDRLKAHNRAVRFAEQIIPLLPAYVPNLAQ